MDVESISFFDSSISGRSTKWVESTHLVDVQISTNAKTRNSTIDRTTTCSNLDGNFSLSCKLGIRRSAVKMSGSIFGGRPNEKSKNEIDCHSNLYKRYSYRRYRFISSIGLDESRLARQTEISVEVRASGSPVVVEFLVLAFVDICGKNEWIPYLVDVQIKIKEWDWLSF